MLVDAERQADLHSFNVEDAVTFINKGDNLVVLLARSSAANVEKFRHYLSPAEHNRARKYLRAEDYHRSVIAHGIKRWFQSCLSSIPCDFLIYETKGQGKPYCKHPGAAHFNISHAGDWVVLGYSLHQELGVDLEFSAEKDMAAIANYFLAREELAILEELSEKRQYLNKRWTQKEAASKYLMLGMHLDFTAIHINDSSHSGSTYIDGKEEKFSLQTFAFMDGHLSIATDRKPDAINMYAIN